MQDKDHRVEEAEGGEDGAPDGEIPVESQINSEFSDGGQLDIVRCAARNRGPA